MNVKESILNYIRENKGASYIELEYVFDRAGFDWRGDFEIYNDTCENVVFWNGWNQEAIDLLNELQLDGLIRKIPTQMLIYLVDGRILTYPLLDRDSRLTTRHWLPIEFIPTKGARKRLL